MKLKGYHTYIARAENKFRTFVRVVLEKTDNIGVVENENLFRSPFVFPPAQAPPGRPPQTPYPIGEYNA